MARNSLAEVDFKELRVGRELTKSSKNGAQISSIVEGWIRKPLLAIQYN